MEQRSESSPLLGRVFDSANSCIQWKNRVPTTIRKNLLISPYSYNVQNNASVGTADTIVDPSCENTKETLTKDCNAKSLK